MVMTSTEANFVVIIKAVGFFVSLFTHPGSEQSLTSTYWRIDRSISRQIRSETRRTRPSTSILSVFLRKMLLTIAGSFSVPGCKGDSFAWKMTCEPEGRILKKIKDAALQENNLVKLGIVLHAWADSYSHQGFSGLLSKANDIEHLNSNKKVYFSKDIYSSACILWLKRKLFNGCFDNILDRLVPPYGHAQALHYPDEPYIEEWAYEYDKNDITYQSHNPDTKSNVAIYRKAFESITELLKQFLEEHPSHINNSGKGIQSPPEHLYNILLTKKCKREREKVWIRTLLDMKPFNNENIRTIEYDDTKWLREAFINYRFNNNIFTEKNILKPGKRARRIVEEAKLDKNFPKSNWYNYHLSVRWYKKLFHELCSKEDLAFNHEPYFP